MSSWIDGEASVAAAVGVMAGAAALTVGVAGVALAGAGVTLRALGNFNRSLDEEIAQKRQSRDAALSQLKNVPGMVHHKKKISGSDTKGTSGLTSAMDEIMASFNFNRKKENNTAKSVHDPAASTASPDPAPPTNPADNERSRLESLRSELAENVIAAVEHVAGLTGEYGLAGFVDSGFRSCFDGIEPVLRKLYASSVSNEDLKKGTAVLQERLNRYEKALPGLETEQERMAAMYKLYVNSSEILAEPVSDLQSFESVESLKLRLRELKKRADKAAECAKVYKILGHSGYLCYAWDQELRAAGYQVHTRGEIAEMTAHAPHYASVNGKKIPYYEWKEDEFTQLYSMGAQNSLQMIVHEDGSVSMQTISDSADHEKVKSSQKKHCTKMKELRENLRKNWFIEYEYDEMAPPEKITSVSAWLMSDDNLWKKENSCSEERRNAERTELKTMEAR